MNQLLLAVVDDQRVLADATNPEIAATIADDLDLDGAASVCARPHGPILHVPAATEGPTVRIGGYWHDSIIEGPGRRSVVRFQGCPIHCPGCYVPETWSFKRGTPVNIDVLADALLDPTYERDGVTILGGEPFAQPVMLNSLIGKLRGRQPDLHILVYSGYTLDQLEGFHDPDIDAILADIDILIDGPYVAALAEGAGPWTGSSNQQVHLMHVLGKE